MAHKNMTHAQIERISKALADQSRLRIYEAIAKHDVMNCGQIVALRDVTPATVSHHLKVLADAGLIESRRKGQFVYSNAVPETIAAYAHAVTKMAGRRAKRREH